MPNRSSKLLGLFCVVAAPAFGQSETPIPADQLASVTGVVVNSQTGAPVLRAHVTLRTTNSPQGQTYGAMTDAEGKFSMSSLAPGVYIATANRVGYVTTGGGMGANNRVNLKPGAKDESLKLKLMPAGSIRGRVVDANGEPMEDVRVGIESSMGNMGQSTTTDSQGQFRIGGLAPGKYRMRATIAESGMPFPADIHPDGTVDTHYGSTYFPGVTSSKEAQLVAVTPGSDVENLIIRMVRTPLVKVSGKIVGLPEGTRNATLSVSQGRMGARQMGIAKPDGSFEVWGLDPGPQILSAFVPSGNTPQQSGPVEVFVGDSNIENVELRIIPPADFTVTVQYDDEKAKPPAPKQPPDQQQQQQQARAARPGQQGGQFRPNLMLRTVLNAPTYFRMQPSAEIGPDGTAVFRQVPPGKFRIVPNWGGRAYVKSLLLGSTEMPGGILDLSQGAAGAAVTVVLSSATGSITGIVRRGDEPAANQALRLTSDPYEGQMTAVTSGPDGTYKFQGLAPGKYKLTVVDENDPNPDPETSDGIEISVRAGEEVTKDVKAPAAK